MVSLTNYMSYRVKSLNNINERLSQQMSTGKQINIGSDNSQLYARDLDIKDKIRIYSGLKEQLVNTTAFNSVADTTVGQVKEQVGNLKDAITKALGNDQLRGNAERATNISSLKSIRETMITLGNTEINGEYLFTGIDTTIKPMTGEFESDFEETGKIEYGGKDKLRKIAVEPSTYRERGVTGKELFFSTEIYQKGEEVILDRDDKLKDDSGYTWEIYHEDTNANKDLSDDIMYIRRTDDHNIRLDMEMIDISKPYRGYKLTGNLPLNAKDDTGAQINPVVTINTMDVKHNVFDDIQTAIMGLEDKVYDYANTDPNKSFIDGDKENYTDVLNHASKNLTKSADTVSIAHAKLGSRNKVFNLASQRVDQKITHYTIFQEQVTGVDYAKASMELKSLELTYQAMFSTITKLNEMSLVKFMR